MLQILMNVYHNTIVTQTPTVPTFKDHLTVIANMDIKEMVFIVKVLETYSILLAMPDSIDPICIVYIFFF